MVGLKTQHAALALPTGIEVEMNNSQKNLLMLVLVGPLGVKRYFFKNFVRFQHLVGASKLLLSSFDKKGHALRGAYAANLRAGIRGLGRKYAKFVELRGLGYRLKAAARGIEFAIGYSHAITYNTTPSVNFAIVGTKSRVLQLKSSNWAELTQNVSAIRRLRPVGVYKEKGVYEKYEKARCKSGKKKKNLAK